MICYKCLREIDITDENTNIKHGLHSKCFHEWFEIDYLKQDLDFESLALRSGESSYSNDDLINTSFFVGAFKKYSARLNNKMYLLKVVMSQYPDLPKIEYICNLIAKSLDFDVPNFYLIKLENNLDCFVSYNFMQNHSRANLVHIFHFLDQRKRRNVEYYNCKNLLDIIKNKTSSYGDIVKFIEICLFDALIGNHDRHVRNIALIQNTKRFILSPIYDNPSYIAIEDECLLGAMHEPYGKIATDDSLNPTIKDYISEFKKLGYEEEVLAFIKRINLDLIKKIIQKPFVNIKRQEALIRIISRRYNEALDAI